MGFALEYYDPVGRKRKQYRHVEEQPAELEGTTFQKKLKFTEVSIDAAMTLPDGREVRDLPTLKAALMADKERILKGMLEKLISYAHGREITRTYCLHVDEVFSSMAEASLCVLPSTRSWPTPHSVSNNRSSLWGLPIF